MVYIVLKKNILYLLSKIIELHMIKFREELIMISMINNRIGYDFFKVNYIYHTDISNVIEVMCDYKYKIRVLYNIVGFDRR